MPGHGRDDRGLGGVHDALLGREDRLGRVQLVLAAAEDVRTVAPLQGRERPVKFGRVDGHGLAGRQHGGGNPVGQVTHWHLASREPDCQPARLGDHVAVTPHSPVLGDGLEDLLRQFGDVRRPQCRCGVCGRFGGRRPGRFQQFVDRLRTTQLHGFGPPPRPQFCQ